MRPISLPGTHLGRDDEVALLRRLVADVTAGQGQAVLVEGEPGIGKSALLATGLADVGDGELAWAVADELSQRFPLRVLLDCLAVESRSADPRRAAVAARLRGERSAGPLAHGDRVQAASEGILALVDQLCTDAPLVLVVDDLHWADDASLALWRRLARMVDQVPLLLVGACRPVPRSAELDGLRRALAARDGAIVSLGPLADSATDELVGSMLGAPAGTRLRQLTQRAAGNPLYVREVVDALLRGGAVRIEDGVAELADVADDPVPPSLTAAIARRLGFLSADAIEVLRVAALLGNDFAVTELSTVVGRPPTGLIGVLGEAVSAGVVTEAGPRLTFRHPLIRQALYETMPGALRAGLHRHAAQVLADAGAPMERIAAHLLSVPAADGADSWVIGWLTEVAVPLSYRAPQIAVELLRRAVDWAAGAEAQREVLATHLATILFRLGQDGDAERYARQVLAVTRDPDRAAELRWILAYLLPRGGRSGEALPVVRDALGDPALPGIWRPRFLAIESMITAWVGGSGGEDAGRKALELGEALGDRLAVGYALSTLAVRHSRRGDDAGAVERIERAVAVVGDDPQCTSLLMLLLTNLSIGMANLNRFDEARDALRRAREVAEATGDSRLPWLYVNSAENGFWTGRWDDAAAELDALVDPPGTANLTVKWHGLAALIAGHRDDRATATAHLRAAEDVPITTAEERVHGAFRYWAEAVAAERDGDPERAVRVLAVLLDPTHPTMAMTASLLPDLVRLAVAAGDQATARAAVRLCEAQDGGEPTHPGTVAAVGRCRGTLLGDPAPLLAAAGYYRDVGRRPELAQTLEDAAVLLAERGDVDAARAAFTEAVDVYTNLGAAWTLRRIDARLRPYGIRRGVRGARRRPSYGWAALSPTEVTIAHLVAQGRSNPDIAAELLLSRRTVQSHVSHILAKINARSRVTIAREALGHLPPDQH
jgi:DNA-binding CsgD family transcriptional regulator